MDDCIDIGGTMTIREGLVDPLRQLAESVLNNPVLAGIGAFLGVLFPLPVSAPIALVLLAGIDTYTGRLAALYRGESVLTSIMRKMAINKLQGYLIFILAAALASMAAGDTIMLKGAYGLLSAIEFFSIAENLYDMKKLPFDPRKVPLFRGIAKVLKGEHKKGE